jgi:hypothetical protein
MRKKNVCKSLLSIISQLILYHIFYFSKQITENHCLERYLDVSIDIIRQINALWEPLQRLAPLFNISTKADFLVSFQKFQQHFLPQS